ncbi:MAG: hypothetical protein RLZZ135_2630 [Cyanobacteriota bacterium]|jgi:hypothetical protein
MRKSYPLGLSVTDVTGRDGSVTDCNPAPGIGGDGCDAFFQLRGKILILIVRGQHTFHLCNLFATSFKD